MYLTLLILAWSHEARAQRVAGEDASTAHRSHTMSAPTRIIRAWRKLALAAPVYSIDDLAATPGWLHDAELQVIRVQSGQWNIGIEPGFTVFRIYPYIGMQPPPDSPGAYECLILKVEGHLTVADLLTAIRERRRDVTIDAFALYGVGVQVVRQTWVRLDKGHGSIITLGRPASWRSKPGWHAGNGSGLLTRGDVGHWEPVKKERK